MYVWEQKISRVGTIVSKGLFLSVDMLKVSKDLKKDTR